jgi:hypothetical protein
MYDITLLESMKADVGSIAASLLSLEGSMNITGSNAPKI